MQDAVRAQLKSQQTEFDAHLRESSNRLREWGKSLEKARAWLSTLDHRLSGLAQEVGEAKPSRKARVDGGARKQLDTLRHELSAAEKTQDARYFDLLSKVRPPAAQKGSNGLQNRHMHPPPPQLGDVDNNVSHTRGAVRRLVATSVDKRKLGSVLEKERQEVGQKLDQAVGRVEVRLARPCPQRPARPDCALVLADTEGGLSQKRVGDRVRAEVTQRRQAKRRGGRRSRSPSPSRDRAASTEEGVSQQEVKEAGGEAGSVEEAEGAEAEVSGVESGEEVPDGGVVASGEGEEAAAADAEEQQQEKVAAEDELTEVLASLVSGEVQKALDQVEESQSVRAREVVEEAQRAVTERVEEQVEDQWRRKCGQVERDLRELRKLVFQVRCPVQPLPPLGSRVDMPPRSSSACSATTDAPRSP